jgi:hypothetical protein
MPLYMTLQHLLNVLAQIANKFGNYKKKLKISMERIFRETDTSTIKEFPYFFFCKAQFYCRVQMGPTWDSIRRKLILFKSSFQISTLIRVLSSHLRIGLAEWGFFVLIMQNKIETFPTAVFMQK